MQTKQPGLFFDLDITLLREFSIITFLEHLSLHYEHIEVMMRETRPAITAYHEQRIPREKFVGILVREFWDKALYLGIAQEHIYAAAQHVYEVKGRLFQPFTLALIESGQELGMPTFVITGTHQEIAEMIFSSTPDVKVIGVRHDLDEDGIVIGIAHDPTHDKGAVVRQLAEEHDIDLKQSVALGDSRSDIPMLECVRWPICFKPDKTLEREAKLRRWPIVLEDPLLYVLHRDEVKHLAQVLPPGLAMHVLQKLRKRAEV